MIKARDLTFEAVRRIVGAVHPGMTEGRSHDVANEILAGMGMERLWHRNVIRFGAGTLETFFGDFQPDYVLGADDIFYVDLGVVWDGHEGDAGDTFVVGDDPQMHACAEAARKLWHEVAARWRDEGLNGPRPLRLRPGPGRSHGLAAEPRGEGPPRLRLPARDPQGRQAGRLRRDAGGGAVDPGDPDRPPDLGGSGRSTRIC